MDNYMGGHVQNIKKEITEYLDDYFEKTKINRSKNLQQYITEQIDIIINGLLDYTYEQNIYEDDDIRLDKLNPETTPNSFYHDAIEEFGTVFNDFKYVQEL